jgi:hypothetical protein
LTEESNGNTLVISLADENDAGDYICQVSTYKPTEIKHSVKIRGERFYREDSFVVITDACFSKFASISRTKFTTSIFPEVLP